MIECAENTLALKQYLSPYGIELEDKQLSLILRHLDLIVEKNKVMNLTRIIEPKEAIIRHDVDSLLLLPSIQDSIDISHARFLDIGTGGGVPGIPLGIASGMRGTLIDSIGKKINAVNEFIHDLGLEDHLVAKSARAEEIALTEANSYDVVVSRAVGGLGILVEYATPLLSPDGLLVVSKANIKDSEVEAGVETGKITGLELVSRETYELPEDSGHREIFTFRRVAKSRVKLPRANGYAKSKPLVVEKK